MYAMKDCHMETKEASCAKEFWKLCENEVPELVLLDIMLPDEDGISIVKKMREDARLSDVPVILVTAKGTEIDKVRGLDAGADDYIAKPFWYFGDDFPREGRTAPQQIAEALLKIIGRKHSDERRETPCLCG